MLRPGVPDQLVWKWTSDQSCSTSSAYRTFIIGQASMPGAKILRKTRIPGKCKFLAGWCYMIAAGQQQEEDGITFRIMVIVCFTVRNKKQSPIFLLAALLQGKFVIKCRSCTLTTRLSPGPTQVTSK